MAGDPTEAITALQAELTALRAQMAGLRAELDLVRERGTSMRGQTRCTSCGCRRILHVTEVPEATVAGFKPAVIAINRKWRGLSEEPRGELQAFVCTGCGLVEWYVPEIAEVTVDGDKVRLVDAETADQSGAGPYRSSE